MTTGEKVRNLGLVLLGAAVLVLKHAYHGPLARVVHNYAGNFCASFAVYFLCATVVAQINRGRLAAVASALLIVETFELTNGFGIMVNTYDPVDLLANATGVGLALAIDRITQGRGATRGRR